MATKKTKLTGPEQVKTMQRLSQQAAAWLIGMNARSLRDQPNIPRQSDGSYDARDLLAWAKSRLPDPVFSDDDLEKQMVVCDHYGLTSELADSAVVDFLEHLQNKYGDPGLAVFARDLLEYCRQFARAESPEPTRAELLAEVEEQVEHKQRSDAYSRLRTSTVCEQCGRLRCGPRWVKRKPPAGYAVMLGHCLDCELRE